RKRRTGPRKKFHRYTSTSKFNERSGEEGFVKCAESTVGITFRS
uniref:Ribosomal protein L32 n=1 Tax=Panagrolaimus sp. JU765 TaxID=591449 RepID=A0AC34QAU0_9BILA